MSEVEQDVELIDEPIVDGEPDGESPEPSGEEVQDDGPLVVSFGDDEPETFDGPAPDWVKELRRRNAEQSKRIKELEAKTASPATTLPPKPVMADYDYDPELFTPALEKWFEQKADHDRVKTTQEAETRAVQEDFERRVAQYNEGKAKLPVDDVDIAEAVVLEHCNDWQQGLLVKVADQPALFMYALGKNPTKLKALAAIKDQVEFIKQATRMEINMKQGKKAPSPERVLSGSGVAGSTGVDNQLEKLREEAARTGDFSKVRAYRARAGK